MTILCTNISVGTHSFKLLKNTQNSLRTFTNLATLPSLQKGVLSDFYPNNYWSRFQVEFFFLLQLIIFVNSIITNKNFVSIHIISNDMIVVELQKYSSQLPSMQVYGIENLLLLRTKLAKIICSYTITKQCCVFYLLLWDLILCLILEFSIM